MNGHYKYGEKCKLTYNSMLFAFLFFFFFVVFFALLLKFILKCIYEWFSVRKQQKFFFLKGKKKASSVCNGLCACVLCAYGLCACFQHKGCDAYCITD